MSPSLRMESASSCSLPSSMASRTGNGGSVTSCRGISCNSGNLHLPNRHAAGAVYGWAECVGVNQAVDAQDGSLVDEAIAVRTARELLIAIAADVFQGLSHIA